jgi:hypothetical protein
VGITKLPRFAEAREVTARTATCARLAQRLPSGAFKDDLRCLAPPALELAEHIPVLARLSRSVSVSPWQRECC